MCSLIFASFLVLLCLDWFCTELFCRLAIGSFILGCFSVAGFLLLLTVIFFPPRKNAPSLLLPAILMLLPGILTNVLGIILLVPAWRQWLLKTLQTHFSFTKIYNRTHPNSQQPAADDDVIDVDVTVNKDDEQP